MDSGGVVEMAWQQGRIAHQSSLELNGNYRSGPKESHYCFCDLPGD